MKNSALYPHLQLLPKAVLHHVHFDCCEDEEFVVMPIGSTVSTW